MMGGPSATTLHTYLEQIVQDRAAAGDTRVRLLAFAPQDFANGLGADWHPNVKTHKVMATALCEALHRDLKWEGAPETSR
jgi:hypothetical protein